MTKIYIKGDRRVIVTMLAPLILMLSVFLFYPLGKVVVMSFFKWNGFSKVKFIGVENYLKMFNDPIMGRVILNTLIIIGAVVVFQVGIAIVLALLVDLVRFGQNFFKTVYFFPIVIASSALALLFQLFYAYDGGMLNAVLAIFKKEPVLWITETSSLFLVLIPTIWQYVGFYFVIILTSLTKIPESYYEAANLEGANTFQRIWHITLPLIFGDVKVCLILAITGGLKVFDFFSIITGGGPFNSSEVFGTYLYSTVFRDSRFGYGCAIAVVTIVLGLLLSFLTSKFLKTEEISYA